MATKSQKGRRKVDDPWDTKLSDEKLRTLANDLCEEIDAAVSARSELMDDDGLIDLWHALYGQLPRNRKGPWPGAADLGSYIPAEKVDATRARFVKIIGKAEPLCVVEGRGATAKNAPIVEEIHEWHQQREEKLLVPLIKVWHQGLIERVGILESYEKIERVVTVDERDVLVQVDPENIDQATGHPAVVLVDGKPVPERGNDGNFIDARTGEPQAKIKVRTIDYVHKGPRHRVISGKDFVWTPAHARDREEDVWGYWKRFYRSNAKLDECVKNGYYDKDAVTALGTLRDRPQTATENRQSISVQHTGQTATSEHELWEGQVFLDLDDYGPRWHLITLSKKDRRILRIKDDTINRCRFTLFVFFPREDGIDGYSFVGDKLYTLAAEHEGIRNGNADRSNLAINAPILRLTGSKWRPQIQPWGPRQVIDVDQKDEISQVAIKDMPESGLIRGREVLQAAERVSGSSDIVSSGVVEGANPTATQIASSAAYSNARLEEQVTLGQEALENVYELRHLMLIRMLEFNEGMEVDQSVADRLKDRGFELPDGKVTAELLKGPWRFKPRGSVESADPVLVQKKFQQRYGDLMMLVKTFPALQGRMQDPALADAALQDWADVHKPRDRQAFLKPAPPPAPPAGGPFGGAPMAPGALPAGMAPPGMPGGIPPGSPALMEQPQGAM